MKHFYLKTILFFISSISLTAQITNDLSLQGVMDFSVPSGGTAGKAIHLVANADIADLSVFGIGVANNGDGTDGLEYSLDPVSASNGDHILVARSVEAMSAYFADCYSAFDIIMIANGNIDQNGNDAIELYEGETVIETFGDVDVSGSLSNALSLKGIIDFTVPSGGNDGKAIHLVANSDITDLSVFGIGLAFNGGGSNGQDFSIPEMSVSSGDQILLANSPDVIGLYFGDCAGSFDHIVDVSVNFNGNDAIELFEQGVVIQTFGDVNVDGTGEAWEYTDSWAYMVGDTWTYGGVNCTDGSQTSATSDCPYPICAQTPIDIYGCMDPTACNFNADATQNDGSCVYAEIYYDCDGNCINDADLDGICDELDDDMGIDEVLTEKAELIKMIDVLGRVHTVHHSGLLLFYIYDNGKVQGVIKK